MTEARNQELQELRDDLPRCWALAEVAMKIERRVLLHGVPGTGKTFAGIRFGVSDPAESLSLTMHQESWADELRGYYVEPGRWADGPAIRAWREPGRRLVLNEIDRAGGDALSFLYNVADDLDSAAITLPEGETVRPSPGFSLVATTNADPASLELALQDRFPSTIEITEPHPDAFSILPEELRGAASRKLGGRYRLRDWLSFSSMLAKGASIEIAAAIVFPQWEGDVIDAVSIARAERSSDSWTT